MSVSYQTPSPRDEWVESGHGTMTMYVCNREVLLLLDIYLLVGLCVGEGGSPPMVNSALWLARANRGDSRWAGRFTTHPPTPTPSRGCLSPSRGVAPYREDSASSVGREFQVHYIMTQYVCTSCKHTHIWGNLSHGKPGNEAKHAVGSLTTRLSRYHVATVEIGNF